MTLDVSSSTSFMALVDAAASILDKNTPNEGHDDEKVTQRHDENEADAAKQDIVPNIESEAETPKGPHGLKKNPSFAEHLMAVLEDEENSDVLSWMPDGKAFMIANPKKFAMEVMPKSFNIRNMSSFVRKLGRWGFQRVHEQKTGNSDIFKHRNFQKGNWELCSRIRCIGRLANASKPRTAVCKFQSARKPDFISTNISPSRFAFTKMGTSVVEPAASPLLHCGTLRSITSKIVSAAVDTLCRDENSRRKLLPQLPLPLCDSSSGFGDRLLPAQKALSSTPFGLLPRARANNILRAPSLVATTTGQPIYSGWTTTTGYPCLR